jgi:gamma-glutamylputrescine oxidase
MFSLWELESFYAPQDVIIAGGGFAGLWSAYHLQKLDPDLKILVIEKNRSPAGASIRNAGFSCFGSVTELMDDAKTSGEEKMLELVALRYEGLKKINKVFSAHKISYKKHGGYELITRKQYSSKKQVQEHINWLNESLLKTIGHKNIFRLADKKIRRFDFQNTDHLIENKLEGQLHPGLMMQALIQKLQGMGVRMMTGIEFKTFEEVNNRLLIHSNTPAPLTSSQLLICTNGLSGDLLTGNHVVPARGQVLVTSAINDLSFKGTFHYDEGFYYFRNLGNRVLLGGARNKAFEDEQTTEVAVSDIIQMELERFLKEVVLYGKNYTIEQRWSGIMGMGTEKFPIIKAIKPNCFCLVGLGGMGVSLAPVAGRQVAEMMVKARD